MAIRLHSVTSQQVRALAEGTSTQADLALLRTTEASRCLATLALIVRDAKACRHPEADAVEAAWQLLIRVQREAPEAAAELLRYPSVGAWATGLATGGGETAHAPAASPGQLALVAAAAAIRGRVSSTVSLPPSALDRAAVHLPSLGTVILPATQRSEVTIRHHDGTTEISGRPGGLVLSSRRLGIDAPGWHALATVRADADGGQLRLVVDDADPYRLPGDVKLSGQLSPVSRDEWRRRITGGWRVLVRDHQRTAADIAALIRIVVPLATSEGNMRSVTSRRVFGAVGLSLPADDVLMALTLAHEVQHAKLSALMDLVPLVNEPVTSVYYAPWRPDPRPLASLLQGLYAHLEVARFWRRHRTVALDPAEAWHANVEFARWRNSCAQAAQSVRGHPGLTSCGSVLVDGMINVLQSWHNDSIPAEATAQADREIIEHKRQWDARQRVSRETAST
jgi:uncharacterized protein